MLGRSYGANNAVLGWNKQPFEETIAEVKASFPKISRNTIEYVLKRSMVDLFEAAVVREDADPTIEAHAESILEFLQVDDVYEEVKAL